MSRLTVEKTYAAKPRKKDTSSDLFDAILSSNSEPPPPPRRSPRKLNPHPISQPSKSISPPAPPPKSAAPDDPFEFHEPGSPTAASSPPQLPSFRKRKQPTATPSSPPEIHSAPEPVVEDLESSASSSSSQPQRSSAKLMPPPRSPPLRLPSLTKAASAPAAALTRLKPTTASKARIKPQGSGVYAWRGAHDSDDEEEEEATESSEPTPPVKLARTRPWAAREEQQLQPLRRGVKDAHQIHDHGEAVEQRGDVEYLIGSLSEGASPELRCLALLQLARKALKPSFRAFLRSSNSIPGIFRRLLSQVSGDEWVLSLPASLLLYLLSRDRMGIPADESTLRLAICLAKVKAPPSPVATAYAQAKAKVWAVLDAWAKSQQAASPSFSFDVTEENLSAAFLATEALVFVSSRAKDAKAKEAMLNLGILQFAAQGLDAEARLIRPPADEFEEPGPETLDRLKLVERFLRILEHCTLMSTENQTFLVSYRNSLVLGAVAELMRFFVAFLEAVMSKTGDVDEEEAEELMPTQKLALSAFTSFLRLLCNLANNNQLACMRLGQMPDFLARTLGLVTKICPERLPPSKLFDTSFFVLSLLINLVEHNNANRRILIGARVWVSEAGEEMGSVEALCRLFGEQMRRAELVEESVDAELHKGAEEAEAAGQEGDREEALKESVASAMAKAGAHMEEGMAAAYLALLLGFLVLQNEYLIPKLCQLLPGGSLRPCIGAMQQLSDFMALTQSGNNSARLAIAKVIELFQRFDKAPKEPTSSASSDE